MFSHFAKLTAAALWLLCFEIRMVAKWKQEQV